MPKKYMTKTKTFNVWYEDGVAKIQFNKGRVEKEDIPKIVTATDKIRGKIKKKLLPEMADIRTVKFASPEVLKIGKTLIKREKTKKVAILFGGPISRTIASFFLGICKPTVPTKAFSNEEEAIKWLKK